MGAKKKNKKRIWPWIAAAVLLAVIALGLDNRLCIRHYSVDTDGACTGVRIALVTDLHSCKYGEGQRTLIEALDAQQPDVVLLGGDILDDELPDENAERLIAAAAERYPCYYVSGNHEYWSGAQRFAEKMAILEKYGVRRLSGEWEELRIGDAQLCICGVDDPDAALLDENFSFEAQLTALNDARPNDVYTLLLSHRPEYWDVYAAQGYELTLCGHAHGGQWRIPLILNGVYAPNQGFFPKLAGGAYVQDDTTMIVSRGLARESTRVPRFFNRPELVIIDLE